MTIERQDGYAARCEVDVDGQTQLCGISFGGFDTRTDARAAIRHHITPAALAADTEKAAAVAPATAQAPTKGTYHD